MELQNNPDQDVTPEEVNRVRADPKKSYAIRLLHLTNGMLLIGYVIEIFPETILLLRPYVVEVDYDSRKSNIDGYKFEPYLNQLVHFDPNGLDPMPFVMSNVISVSVPAKHLQINYEQIVALHSRAVVNVEDIKIKKRHYLNNNTVH